MSDTLTHEPPAEPRPRPKTAHVTPSNAEWLVLAYLAAEPRLRLALRVAQVISERDSNEIARAWFMGLNPQLNGWSPARLLREGELDEVGPEIIAAARGFGVGE